MTMKTENYNRCSGECGICDGSCNPKIHWLWYWGINQKKLSVHSKKKKFTDFDKMKSYSAKHSKNHKWIGKNYWSNYDKIIK